MRRASWILFLVVPGFAAASILLGAARGTAAPGQPQPPLAVRATPPDNAFGSAGGPDVVRAAQWHLDTMNLAQAHQRATGTGIVVAVIDSGVDAAHPDLAGQVLPGPDPAATIDRDGRGTALAGLIAGRGHVATSGPQLSGVAVTASPVATPSGTPGPLREAAAPAGVLGIAPGAKILPVAFAPEPLETGDPDKLADAIDYAVAQRVNIICIGRGVAPSPRLHAATAAALAQGIIVIAADGSRVGQPFTPWPASYPGVLTAVAADRNGDVPVAPVSGRSTGIAVPGVDLISTGQAGGYRIDSGTSAAAVLAGAAAVVWSAHPGSTAAEVTNRLRMTADDRGVAGPDARRGVGDLNLMRALTEAVPTPSLAPAPSLSPTPSPTPSAVPVALLDSGDWKRWLVIVPLVLFLIGLATWAVRTARAEPSRSEPAVR